MMLSHIPSGHAPRRADSFGRISRAVVKIGTNVLTTESGAPALTVVGSLVKDLADWHQAGHRVVLVSSGAVAMGVEKLGWDNPPTTIHGRQVCAAVGQGELMRLYAFLFGRQELVAGQILLTHHDLVNPERRTEVAKTIEGLLTSGVIPVINANDAVDSTELLRADGEGNVYGDNDCLAMMVAQSVCAEALVYLTDVDGVLSADWVEGANRKGQLLSYGAVDENGLPSKGGVGGMKSKVSCAKNLQECGIECVIANGRKPGVIRNVLRGEEEGTWFPVTTN